MRAAAGPLLVLVLSGFPSAGEAQAVAELTARCSDASGGAAWCAAGAAAYQAVAAGMGLGASAGSEIPGTSSTLGWRRGLGPRMAVSARFNGARIPLPAVDQASASRLPGLRSLISGASLDGAVGVFDGLRTAPQYGGILALDAIASVGILRLPREDGFHGSVLSAGIGARLGLLRESFDVPEYRYPRCGASSARPVWDPRGRRPPSGWNRSQPRYGPSSGRISRPPG